MPIQAKIIVVLLWLLSYGVVGGVGWHYGDKYRQGVVSTEQLASVNAAVEAGRISAKAESDAAMAFSKKQSDARLAASARDHALELELAKDEIARTCTGSDDSFWVLVSAIRSANRSSSETDSGDGAERGLPGAPRENLGGSGKGTGAGFGILRFLSH